MGAQMLSWPTKDPDEVVDYSVNWGGDDPRLETGETLLTSVFAVDSGTVTIDSTEFVASGMATVWLSGGAAGETCVIRNRVTTSGGRTWDQSTRLRIRSK